MDQKDILLNYLDCLNSATTVEQLIHQTADFMSRVFKPEHCAFWVNGENVSGVPASNVFLAVSRALHNHVSSNNSFVLVTNSGKDVLTSHVPDSDKITAQIYAFPVRLQNRHVATLVLGVSAQLLSTDLISLLLDKLSIALGRAQCYQNAKYSAMTDALTGIYNKAYFLEALKNEVARSARSQRPISLVMFDFDNFKELNDSHGHVEGDNLLKQLGEVLRATIRSIDIPARYGGEEFAIILPETQHDRAFAFAERLRGIVQEKFPTTISIGIATCMNASVSPETLLKEADKALYAAKRNGKNQTRNFLILDKSLGVIDIQQASGLGKIN
ncbi:MAG: GGDEF domain-containing protein [Candidatus Woesearchaeota archaeon]